MFSPLSVVVASGGRSAVSSALGHCTLGAACSTLWPASSTDPSGAGDVLLEESAWPTRTKASQVFVQVRQDSRQEQAARLLTKHRIRFAILGRTWGWSYRVCKLTMRWGRSAEYLSARHRVFCIQYDAVCFSTTYLQITTIVSDRQLFFALYSNHQFLSSAQVQTQSCCQSVFTQRRNSVSKGQWGVTLNPTLSSTLL